MKIFRPFYEESKERAADGSEKEDKKVLSMEF